VRARSGCLVGSLAAAGALLLAPSAPASVARGTALECHVGEKCTGVVAKIHRKGAFVAGAYRDLLSRLPTSAEQSDSESALGTGTSRAEWVQALVTEAEYRGKLVDHFFHKLLDRSPSSVERNAEIQALASNTDEDVIASIVGSAEYYSLAGSTNPGFISNAYQDLLGRSPTASEQATW
jgi:hypothetical protein